LRMRCLKRVGAVRVQASVSVILADASGVPVDAVVSLEPARPAAPSAAKTVEMDQSNWQCVPAVLAVRPGALVRFPNNDHFRHQVYSFSASNRYQPRP